MEPSAFKRVFWGKAQRQRNSLRVAESGQDMSRFPGTVGLFMALTTATGLSVLPRGACSLHAITHITATSGTVSRSRVVGGSRHPGPGPGPPSGTGLVSAFHARGRAEHPPRLRSPGSIPVCSSAQPPPKPGKSYASCERYVSYLGNRHL